MPNEFESLNQIFWISIAVTILIFLIYLKSYLRHGYPRQKSKKKMEPETSFFFVKDEKCSFKLFRNSLYFTFKGYIKRYTVGEHSKKYIIFFDDFYSKKYINFIIKNAQKCKRPVYKQK